MDVEQQRTLQRFISIAVQRCTYTQAPFEDIDEATFTKMSKVLSDVDLTKVIEMDDNTDLSGELACAGGNCEVV